ncbi:MAG: hypothetical protein Q4F42_04150, partial [Rikenellaceae bacterium]|nr:hypothetical protein [Rikenellaceae bacterium]
DCRPQGPKARVAGGWETPLRGESFSALFTAQNHSSEEFYHPHPESLKKGPFSALKQSSFRSPRVLRTNTSQASIARAAFRLTPTPSLPKFGHPRNDGTAESSKIFSAKAGCCQQIDFIFFYFIYK